MKRLVLLISFIIYWALLLLNVILNKESFAIIIFYGVLFLPLTIAILKDKDVLALFIILFYEIAELLMGLMYVASAFVEIEESSVILIITEFITAFYAFSLIKEAFRVLRNKDKNMTWYILVFAVLRCIFIIINFLIAKDFSSEMIISMISNIVFIVAISIYMIFIGENELKILIKNE